MTQEELTMLQSLPLSIKIEKTKLRIKEWYEHWNGQVYVSFSGGKDSTVLLDIARNMYPDIEAVYSDTGLEYPEIKEFVKTFDNVTIVRPKYSFKEILTKYGYPIISKEVANVVANSRRWIAQNTGEAEGKPISDYHIKKLLGLQKFANPNRGGQNSDELYQTLDTKSLQNPTWGGRTESGVNYVA